MPRNSEKTGRCHGCGEEVPIGEFGPLISENNGNFRYRCVSRLCKICVRIRSSKKDAKKKGHFPCFDSPKEIRKSITGKCQICGVLEIDCKKKLSLDHDHETGTFRGWLCFACNFLLGMSGDSPDRLKEAASSLEKTYCQPESIAIPSMKKFSKGLSQ